MADVDWPSIERSHRDTFARLDALVRENRFAISVVTPAVGTVLLVASAEGWLPAWLAFQSVLVLFGALAMRSPLLVGVAPLVGRRATAWLLALVAYTYAVEFVGVSTGLPYGEFHYGVDLGPTVAGIPLGLPLFFVPLVANAYLLCLLLLGPRARHPPVRLPAVVAAVVGMDLVLDPGAVALGFWVYPGGGPLYGVPLSNYAGWVLSAAVAVVALDFAFDPDALLDRLETCEFMLDDLVSFVILWGGVNLWFGQWGAAVVAAAFGVGLVATDRFDAGLFRP